jgi:ribosomal protein L20
MYVKVSLSLMVFVASVKAHVPDFFRV